MKQKITMRRNQKLTVAEAYEAFERRARVKNLSDKTLRTYHYHIQEFYKFYDSEQQVENISEQTIEEYVLFLKAMGNMKDVTICSYLRTIRSFLYFCMENGYTKRFKISMPKYEKSIKATYTDSELQRLLKKPDMGKCDFTEFKIWTLENFLYGTGCRISSALGLKIGDLDFDSGQIVIRKTKNRHQQVIPMSKRLLEVLQEYLEVRGGSGDDYVFCNNYGQEGDRRTFQKMIQDYNLKRNVNKTSAHLFRHTYAKQWIMAGGDMFRLQKILGHSDLTITREYVQMFGQDLQMDFEQFNPLDRMNQKKERIKM